MNTLNQLTGNINVFVNFFASLNRLFCQIRWLDRNLRNSSGPLMALVGVIVFVCYLVYAQPDGPFAKLLTDQGPLVIVCVVIGVLLTRRYQEGGNTDNNLNSVMFGNPANNPLSANDNSNQSSRGNGRNNNMNLDGADRLGDIEMGTKIENPPRFVQPVALQY